MQVRGDAPELHYINPSMTCATTSSSGSLMVCVEAEFGYCNSTPETSKHFVFLLDEEYRAFILCRDGAELYWDFSWHSEI